MFSTMGAVMWSRLERTRLTFGASISISRESEPGGRLARTPPHRTRTSRIAFAPDPQLVSNLLEGVLNAASCYGWINPPFVDVLGKPLTRVFTRNLGNLPTVAFKSLLKSHVLPNGAESLARTDVLWQLSAEIIVEVPPREAREEIMS